MFELSETLGTFANESTPTNDDSGLEKTDMPKIDFAMLDAAALERVHELETQVVDCDEVCMIRDLMEVENNPNS
jgi:hypothetical protein